MNQSEFKVHSDQETTASELKEKATIAERGKLMRVVRLISPSLLRKAWNPLFAVANWCSSH